MAFHAKRLYDSVTSDGRPAKFVLNGSPPVAEAWAIAFDRDAVHRGVKQTQPFSSARFV